MSDPIKKTMSLLYRDLIASEDAVATLASSMTKEALAEYLVDAFNRGWISPFNVGLDSDGNIV